MFGPVVNSVKYNVIRLTRLIRQGLSISITDHNAIAHRISLPED